MKADYCIVLTTTNSVENKQAIINDLLEQELAACIQSMAIDSHYVWQGEVCCDQEILLVIKTTDRCFEQLRQRLVALHCYEVPQVVKVPFADGFNPYLVWLDENTRR